MFDGVQFSTIWLFLILYVPIAFATIEYADKSFARIVQKASSQRVYDAPIAFNTRELI